MKDLYEECPPLVEACADEEGVMMQASPIRIVHQMACSGGSVICQCLAAMPGVALLSEVHPQMGMLARVNPLKQAQQAYGLVSEEDINAHFAGQISTIHENAKRRSMKIILRDHLHADFIGEGHFQHRIVHALYTSGPLVRVATVRHPIDVWLGLQHNGWLEWTIEQYCARLVSVARSACVVGFVRYEDFTLEPDEALRGLCGMLEIEFDSHYRERVEEVTHITGASGRRSPGVEPRPRRECAEETLDAFDGCPAYHEVCEILGYNHAGACDHAEVLQAVSQGD